MPTRTWFLGVRLGWIMAVEGDRLVASWTVARGFGASGLYALGEWRGRLLGVSSARAAFGDNPTLPRVMGGLSGIETVLLDRDGTL